MISVSEERAASRAAIASQTAIMKTAASHSLRRCESIESGHGALRSG